MTLDSTFVPLAKDLIDRFGKIVTFTEAQDDSSYEPATGDATPVASLTHTGVKISPPSRSNSQWGENDLLEENEHTCLVATSGNAFTAQANWIEKKGKGWQILIDGVQWTVVIGKAVYSGEQIAVWKLKITS